MEIIFQFQNSLKLLITNHVVSPKLQMYIQMCFSIDLIRNVYLREDRNNVALMLSKVFKEISYDSVNKQYLKNKCENVITENSDFWTFTLH